MLARSTAVDSMSSSSQYHSNLRARGRGASPRTGSTSHPVNHDSALYRPPRTLLSSPLITQRHSISTMGGGLKQDALMLGSSSLSLSPGSSLSSACTTTTSTTSSSSSTSKKKKTPIPFVSYHNARRLRAWSLHEQEEDRKLTPHELQLQLHHTPKRRVMSVATASLYVSKARHAMKENDSMVYLEGPQIYSCVHCRTHLTSHDDIVSKSFHGRHGRAFLFDKAVNVTIGKAEDRTLLTGLHSVCDIFCKRCKTMIGWTYARAYEASQKYKENKFIIEKINLYLEEAPRYGLVQVPAGARPDRWRRRRERWGHEQEEQDQQQVYEYCRPKLLLEESSSTATSTASSSTTGK
ncbi:Protein yippee-like [Seminavis robusta]|uniref:Protein yippee-like n=1 Tax=Seminavis robusta TaxID=568900 RepID=A0A9N8HJE6_9STRA|nr:Protein yippee-like [Seminavis robusta]|eukprot:Sro548_g164330.1 Protein yippee-like (351) ;mRNA; r:6337-7841